LHQYKEAFLRVSLRLKEGDQVCIVGGGPAGSFAALHLLHFARQQGMKLKVLIFEPRDFSRQGPGGCNRCAGILSTRLLQGLESLGISLPDEVIQAKLNAYAAHLDGEELRIETPDPQRRIVSVYRGGGPRLLEGAPLSGFDDFLLEQAVNLGAQHIPSHVRSVTWDGQPVVQTSQGSTPAHLLVLATGANSRPPLDPNFGYRPPQTRMMAQDEILLPTSWSADQIDVYFKLPPGLTFGALIPKGRYLNISLLGNGLTRNAVDDFIDAQGLNSSLGDPPKSLCGCTPRIAVSSASRFFGDGWVAVGDAAVTRLYKDGIGSAFFTAKTAMEVASRRGISRWAFQKGYAPYCRAVSLDNLYGRLLFRLWNLTLRIPSLTKAWRDTIRTEASLPLEKRVHNRILWGMFTGDELYRDQLRHFLSPTAIGNFLPNLITSILRRKSRKP
jgi:flavin-dependent dehydrogenase